MIYDMIYLSKSQSIYQSNTQRNLLNSDCWYDHHPPLSFFISVPSNNPKTRAGNHDAWNQLKQRRAADVRIIRTGYGIERERGIWVAAEGCV